MKPATSQKPLVILLLVFGALLLVHVQRCLAATGSEWTELFPPRVLAALVLAAAALLRPVRSRIAAVLDRISHPTPAAIRWIVPAIALASAAYFLLTAWMQGRENLYPTIHDELSYLVQTQMIARGRLWMPPHPLVDFFDTFYVLIEPKYASMYFPGTAIFLAPTVWLSLPTWLLPVLASGMVVALTWLIVTRLIDGAAGALAALAMISLGQLRFVSILFMSQAPLMLMCLCAVWAWLNWRRGQQARWALLAGFFGGWALVIRPVDALCYVVPIGLAMFWDLGQHAVPQNAGPRTARHCLSTFAALLLGAAPFLLLQLLCNVGITGRWSYFPHAYYADRDYPGAGWGFHDYDPALHPVSRVPEKRQLYDQWVVPKIQAHRPDAIAGTWINGNGPVLLRTTLPHPLLVVLMPAALLALGPRRRWVLAAALPLWAGLYVFYPFFTEYYGVAVAPAAILLVLLGAGVVAEAFPAWRSSLAVLVAVLAITALPQISGGSDGKVGLSPLARVAQVLQRDVRKLPAVVLFRRDPDLSPFIEPVYNTDVPWPDDAAIIRAHDRGPDNDRIFRYYAQRQPQRTFYLYDEKTNTVTELGTAAGLAAPR